MKLKEIIKNLEHLNNWRRDNGDNYAMQDTKLIGETIDAAINELKNVLKD